MCAMIMTITIGLRQRDHDMTARDRAGQLIATARAVYGARVCVRQHVARARCSNGCNVMPVAGRVMRVVQVRMSGLPCRLVRQFEDRDGCAG